MTGPVTARADGAGAVGAKLGLVAAAPRPSLWREAGRRFRRHRLAMVGVAVLLVMVAGVVAGPVVWRLPINEIDFKHKLRTPSWAHPLGNSRTQDARCNIPPHPGGARPGDCQTSARMVR